MSKLGKFAAACAAVLCAFGAEAARSLPAEYQEVEWIEATGSQCIDTGILVNKSSSVECDVDVELTSNTKWAGSNGYMQYQANIAGGVRHLVRIVYAEQKENVYLDDSTTSVYSKDWANSLPSHSDKCEFHDVA